MPAEMHEEKDKPEGLLNISGCPMQYGSLQWIKHLIFRISTSAAEGPCLQASDILHAMDALKHLFNQNILMCLVADTRQRPCATIKVSQTSPQVLGTLSVARPHVSASPTI